MRILMLGAGAIGGYFGGRLQQAGCDVSFLVRPRSAARLREKGLVIRSPNGDARLRPRIVTRTMLRQPYDTVILCCKAYDLADALDAIAPAVGKDTTILPLLNGMAHFDALDARFGAEHVLGGVCSIAVALSADGGIEHFNSMHLFRFGERDGTLSPRVAALEAEMENACLDARASRYVIPTLWEKWAMLAGLAAMNCLMRADLTTILNAPGGRALCLQMLDECSAITTACGHPPRPQVLDDIRDFIANPTGVFITSMLRDLEQGHRTEADHIIGDLLVRGEAKAVASPLLQIAYCHLKADELSRPKFLQSTYRRQVPALGRNQQASRQASAA